jgi:preprotein translocase subunit YajC
MKVGDEVLVIGRIVEVTDASQSIDVTVEFSDGQRVVVTDAQLAHSNGTVLTREPLPRPPGPISFMNRGG